MKFSLIMGTYGRRDEVRNFLSELKKQSYKNFEIIVVDQNKSDEIKILCKEFRKCLEIKYIYSQNKGVCGARNLGLKYITGDIVAFPDDDCEYPLDLLERTLTIFKKNPGIDGITGMSREKVTLTQPMMIFDNEKGYVTINNIWRRCIEHAIFLKKNVAKVIGRFDELLGPGGSFGAAEGIDYILRGIRLGFKFYYTPELIIYHPNPSRNLDNDAKTRRAYYYSSGVGALMKKHIFLLKNFSIIPKAINCFIRPCCAIFFYGLYKPERASYYYNTLKGRIHGFIKYDSSDLEVVKKK